MEPESSHKDRLEESDVPASIFIIFALWEYFSSFGFGADYGKHICVYSQTSGNAMYIKTRDLVVHNRMVSPITGRLRQENEINARRDIFSRTLVEAKATLEEQLKYLRETRIEFANCKAVVAQLPIQALDTLLDINSTPQVVYNLLQEGLQGRPAETETL